MFKCPTIGFTCKQRQWINPFPVGQTAFSIPIEIWVNYWVARHKKQEQKVLNHVFVLDP